jgi:hypothetical protein
MNKTRLLVWLGMCALAIVGSAGSGCGARTEPEWGQAVVSISADRSMGAVADGVDAVQLQVAVRDGHGDPLAGVTVQLDATGLRNALTQPAAPTDKDGLATGSLSTTMAELKIVSASIDQGKATATTGVRFSAGPAARLVFVQQPTHTEATAILAPAVAVAVQDRFGNPATSWPAPVSLRLIAVSGVGSLSGATPANTADSVATFSGLSVSTAGQYRLEASSGTLPPTTSDPFTVRLLAVLGTRIEHWINDSGGVDRPQDLRNVSIGAWVPRGAGFVFYAGTGAADGTFQVPGVPYGADYWLCFRTDCFATSERSVDLGLHLQGRPTAIFASPGTLQHTSLTGMAPFTNDQTFDVTDDLQMYASNAGLWFAGLQFDSATTVNQGAVILDQTYDYSLIAQSGYVPVLADAAAGDRTYFNQLTTRDAGFVLDRSGARRRWNTYQAVARSFGPIPLTVTNGAVTNVSGAFTPVPQDKSVQVSWLIAERTPGSFGSYRTAVNPRTWADEVLHLMAIDALPESTHGFYGVAPDLAVMFLDDDPSAPQPDQRLEVVYGDPFPASWARFGVGQTYFLVPYDVPRSGAGAGTTAFTYEVVFITVNDLLPSFPFAALKPRVSPVVRATIDGAPFFNDQTLASATPVIRWNLPEVGTPTFYTVQILRFSAGPTGPAVRALAGRFATTATQLTVPPGFFVPGFHYVVQINATVQTGHDVARAPYEQQWPYDSAPALSGLLTMP